MTEPLDEMDRLEAFHSELAQKDMDHQANALRNGFLPGDEKALMEAGIRCIPLIEDEKPAIVEAAVDRLKAVVFKLRLAPESIETRRVLERFEEILEKKKRDDAANTRYGLLAIGGLVLVIIATLLLVIRWIFH
jgi:hypothetical protein